MEKGGKAQRETPPPRSSQVPHPVLVSCLRHACDDMGAPPPPTHPRPPEGGKCG